MKDVCLSIIVPIYNVEHYLAQCLDSIVQQTFKDYELLLINDGSTDYSGCIAMKYAQKDSRIKYFEKTNGGLSSARNYGLDYANGKYVMFVDSDDFLTSNMLQEIMQYLVTKGIDLLCFSSYKVYDNHGIVVEKELLNPEEPKGLQCTTGLNLFIQMNRCKIYQTGVPFYICKRDVIEKNNIRFIENIIHEDHHYTFMIFMHAKASMYKNLALYNYRIRQGSIMRSGVNHRERFLGFGITWKKLRLFVKKNKNRNKEIQCKEVRKYLFTLFYIALKYYLRGLFSGKISVMDIKYII